jgi:hypothetical protein
MREESGTSAAWMEAYTVQVPDSCAATCAATDAATDAATGAATDAATGAATGAEPSNALALAFIHYNQAQTR